jgi:hypothetical protein
MSVLALGMIFAGLSKVEAAEPAAKLASTPVKDPALIYPICSALSFQGVVFPSNLTNAERTGFELGLNVSGSFEGNDGWANISNDFDGMGLSLGLLNQNLGSGSLQPLLMQMQIQHAAEFATLFTAAQYQSIAKMLNDYGNLSAPGPARFNARRTLLSPHDEWGETPPSDPNAATTAGPTIMQQSLSPEQESVDWARANLYSNASSTDFKPEWLSALQALANNPDYVTIQVGAAQALHEQAWSLMNTIQVMEVRSYLLMFDFVVQDGGIYESDLATYQKQLRKNPKWTDTNKLLAITQLRVAHVSRKWQAATRARKLAIINGTGTVNQALRHLQTQYCYNGNDSL